MDVKKLRIRSPNYPAIGLSDAVERLAKLYPKVHTHKVDKATMARAAGYAGLNGAALSMLSAMKKYGLFEESGSDLRVSENAVTIIADPVDSGSRRVAIQEAAFSPPLFADIRKDLPNTIPHDDVVRSYLIKKGFAPANVDTVIRSFRETMKLVTEEGLGYHNGDSEEDDTLVAHATVEDVKPNTDQPIGSERFPAPSFPQQREIGVYPVGKSCSIRLTATGPYTRRSIEALIKQLQLNLELDVFPEEPTIATDC